jgi:mono/diheme cytochrome c family protein
MPHRSFLVTPLLILCPIVLISGAAGEGVYTREQATRGQAIYAEECAKCHGENLSGGDDSPELAGASFMGRWKGKSVGALYALMSKTMPTDDPGHLSTRQYADLTAFILSSNGLAAGAKELPTDKTALNEIVIEVQK